MEGTQAGCLQEGPPPLAVRTRSGNTPPGAPQKPLGPLRQRADALWGERHKGGPQQQLPRGHTALAERDEGSAGGQFSGTADAQLWKAQGSAS